MFSLKKNFFYMIYIYMIILHKRKIKKWEKYSYTHNHHNKNPFFFSSQWTKKNQSKKKKMEKSMKIYVFFLLVKHDLWVTMSFINKQQKGQREMSDVSKKKKICVKILMRIKGKFCFHYKPLLPLSFWIFFLFGINQARFFLIHSEMK